MTRRARAAARAVDNLPCPSCARVGPVSMTSIRTDGTVLEAHCTSCGALLAGLIAYRDRPWPRLPAAAVSLHLRLPGHR